MWQPYKYFACCNRCFEMRVDTWKRLINTGWDLKDNGDAFCPFCKGE